MKINEKRFQGADKIFDPLMKRLLKKPKLKAYYEQEKAKAELAMVLHLARKKANLTQKQIAKKIGTSQGVIARLESGEETVNPTFDLLDRFGRACGLKIHPGNFFRKPVHG